jgi:hypothetical protein
MARGKGGHALGGRLHRLMGNGKGRGSARTYGGQKGRKVGSVSRGGKRGGY